jgi:ribosomal protein L29
MTACSPWRPSFQSDEQMETNFDKYKAELLTLMQRCKPGQLKKNIKETFDVCKIDQAQLKRLSLEEIAKELSGERTTAKEFNGSRFLFVANQYVDEYAGTFVEEKGYMFSATPITKNLVEKGSLDQFNDTRLLEKKKSEIWKYKQIEKNWYLYYRQYYYTYLG